MCSDSPVRLTPEQEERAQRLHRECLVFICHDHNLLPESLVAMREGGVTAKQLMLSVDARLHADRETFLGSVRGRGYAREARRHGRPPSDAPEADPTLQPLAPDASEGFLKSALIALDYVFWQVEQSEGGMVVALEPDDVVRAKERGAIALLLGSEGSRLIEDRLEVLRMLHRLGLRHLQLSWALETTVGAPQSDQTGRGLTDFGRELIRELNRLGIIVDVSHLADRSIEEAIETSTVPVLNSHTGARALNPEQPQLLTDELIRATAARGGVMAIHFHSGLVKPGRHQAKFDELMAQFEYVARVAGTDHVACGPDYLHIADQRLWENQGIATPFSMTEGVENIGRMLNITRGLVARGFSDEDVGKIMGGNLMRLFRAVRARVDAGPWPYPRAEGIGVATGGTTPL
ncbi:MAG: dipeptidase [Candidatus Limnocylindria bacterium]